MNSTDIPFLSATDLASAIRTREISPVEAVDAYLDRIDAVGDKLNAYITVSADEARADAQALQDEATRGHFRGPLHGVPVGIKDQIYTAGTRTTDASKIRADFVPETDATVVSKLKGRRRRDYRQDQHERVCPGGSDQQLVWPGPESVGYRTQSGDFQHRQRIGHRRLPLRHFSGRGHGRFHSGPGRQLRARRHTPDLGAGLAGPVWMEPAGLWTP